MIAFKSPEFIDVRCLRIGIGGFSDIKQVEHFFEWIKQKNVPASIEIGRFHDPRVGQRRMTLNVVEIIKKLLDRFLNLGFELPGSEAKGDRKKLLVTDLSEWRCTLFFAQ